MKYDPEKHHRRSIRLPGYDYSRPGAYFVTIMSWGREHLFVEIAAGEVQVNDAGYIAQNEWIRLAQRFRFVQLYDYIVMPNHVHGIIVLNDDAVLDDDVNAVGARQEDSGTIDHSPLASPLPETPPQPASPQPTTPRPTGVVPGSLGVIIGAYKSTTARLINGIRRTPGAPVWQRNYYEHIIREESEWDRIRAYIQANPANWPQDRENPSSASG